MGSPAFQDRDDEGRKLTFVLWDDDREYQVTIKDGDIVYLPIGALRRFLDAVDEEEVTP
jgi:hypothetical protein